MGGEGRWSGLGLGLRDPALYFTYEVVFLRVGSPALCDDRPPTTTSVLEWLPFPCAGYVFPAAAPLVVSTVVSFLPVCSFSRS